MTPNEKALELVLKFAFKGAQHEGEAKQFAIIAVNEISNEYWSHNVDRLKFWQEVKQEIEKL